MIDSWSLQVLLAVGQGGSFSAAAAQLQMSQPAVSRQVAALERRLGVSLFQRLPRGVRPTAAGEAAIEHAAAVLNGMAVLEMRMQSIARAEAGQVRVSTFSSAATLFIPECFRTFSELHPDVELSMVGRGPDDPTRGVLEGRIDLALLTSWDPDPMPGVEAIPLVDDEQLVALAQDHPRATKSKVRLRDLAGEPWIEGSHPDCLGPIPELATALGRPPQINSVCDDWNGKQGLVAAGIGVMLYPMVAGRSALRPDIRLLRPSPQLPSRKVYVAALPEPSRAPVVTAFIEVMRDLVSTTVQWEPGTDGPGGQQR
jgi:DNA-binding transcriptional LysR family regulator